MVEVLISFLLGYALAHEPTTEMVKTAEVDRVLVRWEKKAPVVCGETNNALGCAYRDVGYGYCTIVMPEDADDFIVAHEFRHCFGYEHANEVK